MITNFESFISELQTNTNQVIVVAGAHDPEVLSAVKKAEELDLAQFILVGNRELMTTYSKDIDFDISKHNILDSDSPSEIGELSVGLVRTGRASVLMKGIIETPILLKAVLNKQKGLKTDQLLSHVGVFQINSLNRLLLIADSAVNIAPNVDEKEKIIMNTLIVADSLGIREPKVALIAASEHVNEKMPATKDAAILVKKNEEVNYFKPAILAGPLALDNAISSKAAAIKNIKNAVVGNADILIMPTIEAGNILVKSLEYFSNSQKAGVIMGASVPIILTSRASTDDTKLYSIALSLLIQKKVLEMD
ncbi:phosphate acyltransferase [Vagococcus sp. PNs007]|uniref:Phosphate acyltransferase n=1 Tax=Vagococcus proximus TaxID=2991417 RepID=A0ABT5X3A4_9ENTE|nr:phosphate acyltransferase [Vagococcus proximus]MDF0480448.1 phosphate acyltransferase [Vagococcus proximus]